MTNTWAPGCCASFIHSFIYLFACLSLCIFIYCMICSPLKFKSSPPIRRHELCASWEVRALKPTVRLDGDTDEGIFLIECTQVVESFTNQEEEAEFSEEGNRKLLWVSVETVTGWKLRPTPQDCSRGIWTHHPVTPSGHFQKDSLCKACPLCTPTAWLQPVLGRC